MGSFSPLHRFFPTHGKTSQSDNSQVQPSIRDLWAANLCSFFSPWTWSSGHSHSRGTQSQFVQPSSPTTVNHKSSATLRILCTWKTNFELNFIDVSVYLWVLNIEFSPRKYHVLNLTECRKKQRCRNRGYVIKYEQYLSLGKKETYNSTTE